MGVRSTRNAGRSLASLGFVLLGFVCLGVVAASTVLGFLAGVGIVTIHNGLSLTLACGGAMIFGFALVGFGVEFFDDEQEPVASDRDVNLGGEKL